MKQILLSLILCMCFFGMAQEKKATVKGYVFDGSNGNPLTGASVRVSGTTIGAITNVEGFFSIPGIPLGNIQLEASFFGMDTVTKTLEIVEGENQLNFTLSESTSTLGNVVISGKSVEDRTNVNTGVVKIDPGKIKAIPTTGGDPDLATYLSTVQGVVTTGDQGGQIYVRGGTPIQNKVLMDGMTIFNAFHSIGFYSVFDTDILRNVDVYTGGFPARYGGRMSSQMDVVTRDGNKMRHSGKVSVSPFMAKGLFEGPLGKVKDESGAKVSYLLNAKGSYLEQSSKVIYPYVDGGDGLPFNFWDIYGKLTFNAGNGNRINLYGFSFNDMVNYSNLISYQWNSAGGGMSFNFAPAKAAQFIKGKLDFTNYEINMTEAGGPDRSSSIFNVDLAFDFTYFMKMNSQLDYGINVNFFGTDYLTYNAFNRAITSEASSTEFSGYIDMKIARKIFVIEPSVRVVYYSRQGSFQAEPRLGFKINATEWLRFKASGGRYSQSLTAATSDLDVVNLFYGFLNAPDINSVPEERVLRNGETDEIKNTIQTSWHAIAGVEVDIARGFSGSVEGYYKYFPKITTINDNKIYEDNAANSDKSDFYKKDFLVEQGYAYGADLALNYNDQHWSASIGYGWMKVERWNGQDLYAPSFDRRNNLNLILTYNFGKNNSWQVSARWNYGSGFPFTERQGFFDQVNIGNSIGTDISTGNSSDSQYMLAGINQGRLPDYHRLDVSARKSFKFKKNMGLDLTMSVTNVYNRKNVFYVSSTNEVVYQLPVLPSLSVSFMW